MLYENSYNRALKFADSEAYDSVEFHSEWHSYDVYVALSEEGSYTGYPDYILVDSNTVRWADPKETESILFA